MLNIDPGSCLAVIWNKTASEWKRKGELKKKSWEKKTFKYMNLLILEDHNESNNSLNEKRLKLKITKVNVTQLIILYCLNRIYFFSTIIPAIIIQT